MENHLIYPIKDIDDLILLKYTKVRDLFQLVKLNKYYNNLVSNLPLIKEIKEYNSKKDNNYTLKYIPGLYDNLFLQVCGYGLINYAKYLFKNYKINIHKNADCAFRYSCATGHLQAAKWLIDLSKQLNSPIDIHAWNDYVYRYSKQNGHLELYEWLQTLDKISHS